MLTDTRAADVPRTPATEVQLTVPASRSRGQATLRRAWMRVVALGFAALVGCTVFDWRSSRPIGAVLVVTTYALTIAALGWAAVETHRSDRRGRD
jgi:hypothetical protein